MLNCTMGSRCLEEGGANSRVCVDCPEHRAAAQCFVRCVRLQVGGSVAAFNSHGLGGYTVPFRKGDLRPVKKEIATVRMGQAKVRTFAVSRPIMAIHSNKAITHIKFGIRGWGRIGRTRLLI